MADPMKSSKQSFQHTSIDANTVDTKGAEKHTKMDDECQLQLDKENYEKLKDQLTKFLTESKAATIDSDVKEVEQAIDEFKKEFDASVKLISADIDIAKQHLTPLGATTVRSINSNQKLKTIVKPIMNDMSNINNKLKLFNTSRFFTRKGVTHGPEQIVNEFKKKIEQKYESSKNVQLKDIKGRLVIKNLVTRNISHSECTVDSINTVKKEYTVTYQKNSKSETAKVSNDKVCLTTQSP